MKKIYKKIILFISIIISGCGDGYEGNMEIKAKIWAKDYGCDKIENFKTENYISGTATKNNGEVFLNPTKAGLGEYSFDCYYQGVGWSKLKFTGFLLNNPITENDFGIFGSNEHAKNSANQSGFKSNSNPIKKIDKETKNNEKKENPLISKSELAQPTAQSTAPQNDISKNTKLIKYIPSGIITDETSTLSSESISELTSKLESIYNRGFSTMVLLIKTTNSEDISILSSNISHQWMNLPNIDSIDLLIVIAIEDRKIRLATSDPNGKISDVIAKSLVDDFSSSARRKGVSAGLSEIVRQLDIIIP